MLNLEITRRNGETQFTCSDQPPRPTPFGSAQLEPRFDVESDAIWAFMRPAGIPCYNMNLLAEMDAFEQTVEDTQGVVHVEGEARRVRYYVVASRIPSVFNFGGDLALFSRLAAARDRTGLMHYARVCVDGLYRRLSGFGQMIATISVVQGDALGGGFETVLGTHVVVAERSVKMGLPEILFNLFPGMGAYSFLARRVGWRVAEDMIYSGTIYTGAELADLGVVDVLVDDGTGIEAAREFMRQHARRKNGYLGMLRARTESLPVTHDELIRITTAWVDSVLRLDERDMRTMQRLVKAQKAKMDAEARFDAMPDRKVAVG
jgi:DSF synthase